MACFVFPEAWGDEGLVAGQVSSISGSGRRLSLVYGRPRCVSAGGGAEPSNFGKRAAGPIHFRSLWCGGTGGGQGSSISGSGWHSIYLLGGVCCVGTGGGARVCTFGKPAACLIFIRTPVVFGGRWWGTTLKFRDTVGVSHFF